MPTSVLMVAAEAFPLVKTGGLADAVSGLARALHRTGVQVRILLPAYRGVLDRVMIARQWPLDGLPGGSARLLHARCRSTGMDFLLLDNPLLFDRAGCYVDEHGRDYADNARRYAALAHAAAAIAAGLPGLERPDLVHAHDWHAGLAPLLVKQACGASVKTVLTIHNLAFQGVFDAAEIGQLCLPEAARHAEGLYAWGKLNFLQAGILQADRVTTVSHTYAREIVTEQGGCGLDGALRWRGAALQALPNGIDDEVWNPATDLHLQPNGFSAANVSNKARWKEQVQRAFGLNPDPQALLVVSCSRLTSQKMADLTLAGMPLALQRQPELQFAVLGKGEACFEQGFADLAAAWPGRCGVRIGYDEAAAHRLQAGADLLWHPSRFEPFGLTPLYSMRYGALPVATPVGGLADTVRDPGAQAAADQMAMMQANGLMLHDSSPEGVSAVLQRAQALQGQTAVWRAMQRNAMTGAYGWGAAVQAYLSLFSDVLGIRLAAGRSDQQRLRTASQPHPAVSVV